MSQTVPPVATITSISNVNTLLPGQVAQPISQTQSFPATHQRVIASSNTPGCLHPYPLPPIPQAGYLPQPETELLMATAYGIPRPMLPVFESGTNLLSHHTHITEQYKYQLLLSYLNSPALNS